METKSVCLTGAPVLEFLPRHLVYPVGSGSFGQVYWVMASGIEDESSVLILADITHSGRHLLKNLWYLSFWCFFSRLWLWIVYSDFEMWYMLYYHFLRLQPLRANCKWTKCKYTNLILGNVQLRTTSSVPNKVNIYSSIFNTLLTLMCGFFHFIHNSSLLNLIL